MLCRLPEHWKAVARGRAFHVQCVVHGPREPAIDAARDEVQRAGGDVLDFKAFSDLSLNLIVELAGAGVARLADAVAARGWKVEVEPAPEALAAAGAERLEGTFQLTFAAGGGALRHETPAVPG